MILPPFDASRRDESNDICLDFVRSLDGRLFDFSHFYKNRIKPNRTAGFSVRFLRISALIRTVYNPDQTDPFGALRDLAFLDKTVLVILVLERIYDLADRFVVVF